MTELSAPLAEKLARMGITELNDIQRRVLATDKNTESIVLIAPTGSGKTVAYALALLRNMKPSTRPSSTGTGSGTRTRKADF